MRTHIVFQPEDRDEPQTLFADLTREEYDELQEIITDPEVAQGVVVIRSRVEEHGPEHPWMFRINRIIEIRIVG